MNATPPPPATPPPALDPADPRRPASDPRQWLLDPQTVFLNHGSFGACPAPVRECQAAWRERMERQPVRFLARELEPLLDAAREELARFTGAKTENLVFVPNATTGVNTVLRSLKLAPGDELLVTDQAYNACRNALEFTATAAGATVVTARLPFPFRAAEDWIEPILAGVTARTRLALLDHVTSQTGVALPLARLVRELDRRGVDTLVDGAHAPGMVPLNLEELGAAYYTGNCHKWLCAPRGAAFLCVRPDRQAGLRPLVISHGANSARTDRSRFLLEFGWTGTVDPTAWLSVGAALAFMSAALPGGWPAVMRRNRALALAARDVLCRALQIPEPCPAEFIGALASVPLPPAPPGAGPRLPWNESPLQTALCERHGLEAPVITWPAPPHRVLRISAQLYNSLPQYEQLARALREELAREGLARHATVQGASPETA